MIKQKLKELDKYSITYEDETSISIWKYDMSKNSRNPYEVEHKWKKTFNPWENNKKKSLGDLVKEQKKTKKNY